MDHYRGEPDTGVNLLNSRIRQRGGCKAEVKYITENVLVEMPVVKWRVWCTEAH